MLEKNSTNVVDCKIDRQSMHQQANSKHKISGKAEAVILWPHNDKERMVWTIGNAWYDRMQDKEKRTPR